MQTRMESVSQDVYGEKLETLNLQVDGSQGVHRHGVVLSDGAPY